MLLKEGWHRMYGFALGRRVAGSLFLHLDAVVCHRGTLVVIMVVIRESWVYMSLFSALVSLAPS